MEQSILDWVLGQKEEISAETGEIRIKYVA